MASYNKSQLRGAGTPIEALTGGVEYVFNLTSISTGSSYFTIETSKNATGSYSGQPTNALGDYSSFTNISENTLITSSYIASVVLPQGLGSFTFTPSNNIDVSSSYLRGTGDISLNITGPFTFNNATIIEGVNLWVSDESSALALYGPINTWNTTGVTNMNSLFQYETTFNSDISNWDVSNVIDMGGMFNEAVAFNQDISSWDVGNVMDMGGMFYSATAFNNGDIEGASDIPLSWDVSNVTNMSYMFGGATSFNQDISSWDVSNVTECSRFSSAATAWTEPKPNFTNCGE